MTKEEAIQFLIDSYELHLWETNESLDSSSAVAQRNIGNALQVIKPYYHINWACDGCIKNMFNEAVRTKNEHKLHFHKFPKQ